MIRVCVSSDSTNQPVWNSDALGRVPAAEDVEHDEKRGVVEDRAARADEQDEPGDGVHRPGPRPGDLFGIHVVRGDGNLGEIVEQVVGQDLERGHRHERQEDAGAQDAEHVAEVGAGPHADVFEDVGEDLPPLPNPLLQHQQVFLQQDGIRRFLGDIDRRVHGNAHVGGAEGRRVVDAVAQEPHDVPRPLQGLDDALLVGRGQPGEQGRLAGGLRQFRVGHPLHLAAQEHLVGGDADLPANLAAHQFVVPGEHLDRDAVPVSAAIADRAVSLGGSRKAT